MESQPVVTFSRAGTSDARLESQAELGWRDLFRLAGEDFREAATMWHLAWTLSVLDIKLRCRGSLLGPLWLTLSTGVMIGTMGNRARQLTEMQSMVDEAVAILGDSCRPIGDLGLLLHKSWRSKRELANSVSNQKIGEIYEAGREAEAFGGKLLGAGGGGFMVFLVKSEKRQQMRGRLNKLVHVSVDFDPEGSKIVLYQPNGL